MKTITQSQEWVSHDRGNGKTILLRKWQKECWKMLFGHFETKSISHELNTKYLPEGTELVAFEKDKPEEFLYRAKNLLEDTEYDITITIKPKPYLRKSNHEHY